MISRYARWWISMFQPCRRDCAAIRTFSSALELGRMLVIWYDRAIPLREIRSGESPAMSSPLNTIRPEDGRNTPVRQLKKLLFPAPFGPMIARISPRPTSKLTRLRAVRPPKRRIRSSVRRSVAGALSPATSAGTATSNETPAVTYVEVNLQAGGKIVFSFGTTSTMWCLPSLMSKMNSRTNA